MSEPYHQGRVGLLLISAIASLIALIALLVSVAAISGRVNRIETSRRYAADDTCHVLRTLLMETLPPRQAQTLTDRAGLRDCRAYALRITEPHHHHHLAR
jgi:hypothetical protein